MAQELGSTHDDLDKTDRLPILDAAQFESESDFEDDAVRMDRTAILPPNSFFAPSSPAPEFARPPGVDLPSLAESVRSVEERIARQNAEYEALTRSYERARDTESATAARANSLAADLAAARAALESEQKRSREIDKALTDRIAATEASRSRTEEALRESERHQAESRTLRDSLAARDATIVQVLHSLGERTRNWPPCSSNTRKWSPYWRRPRNPVPSWKRNCRSRGRGQLPPSPKPRLPARSQLRSMAS